MLPLVVAGDTEYTMYISVDQAMEKGANLLGKQLSLIYLSSIQ
jgi:hypothetical protein